MSQRESELMLGHGQGLGAAARVADVLGPIIARPVSPFRFAVGNLPPARPPRLDIETERYLATLRDNPPQALLDAIADCPNGVEVTGDYESVAIRPLLIWQAALDALTRA